jgi:metal-responsive CopG/Arc/MetJ family transcriptional regulator
MNTQINLRLTDTLLKVAQNYADKNGYSNVQELVKETLREKLFEEEKLSKKEIILVKKIVEESKKPGFYAAEKDLLNRFSKNK